MRCRTVSIVLIDLRSQAPQGNAVAGKGPLVELALDVGDDAIGLQLVEVIRRGSLRQLAVRHRGDDRRALRQLLPR